MPVPWKQLFLMLLFAPAGGEDRLWHLRNLGKAFYENPTTQKEAVEQFRQALALNPQSARERVNFGLALLKAGETKPATVELEKAQKQDPSIPHTWFNLGIIAKREGDYARGIQQMERMVALVPDEPTAHHNLATLYKLSGRQQDALREFETAARLNPDLAAPHFQLYTLYKQSERPADAARELSLFQKAKQRQEGAAIPESMEANNFTEIFDIVPPPAAAEKRLQFAARTLAPKADGVVAVGQDLIAWTQSGVSLYVGGTRLAPHSGLEALRDIVSIAAGDYDNDGLPDLCVITKAGPALFHNNKGTFSKTPVSLPPGDFRGAFWVDYDHDYDLDLMLLGPKSVLLRNQGDAGFTDQTSAFPFASGTALTAANFALRSETPARDLVIGYEDHDGVVYADKLNGRFEAVPLPALPAGPLRLVSVDLNHDGLMDLAALYPDRELFLTNQNGALAKADAAPAGSAVTGFVFGRFVPSNLPDLRDAVALDWNAAGIGRDGVLHFFENQSTPKAKWLRVGITGIKNLKLAEGATVEVKAGSLYQKAIYHGQPLLFPMGDYSDADTVRVTWPNGLIQNETHQAVNKTHSYPEAQRLSGSCPMIFTWNGKGFGFITDVLGVAPLGASSGDGSYFPVDHDEYIQIPGEALAERAGNYEIRVTEELREVSYLDQIQLIAVDHPGAQEIFTNDKFKSPPFPDFRLFGVKRRVYPVRAHDDANRDILPALLKQDGTYPTGFDRDYTGVAGMHAITLDFGRSAPENRAVLFLNGWVDWADGSTFLGAAQSKGGGLALPRLEVLDTHGQWRTVVPDMGIPSGKPKTISVDLTGKFLSASRQVRIVTNLCVYWDEIFLSESSAPPDARLTAMDAGFADLRFRGFSTPVIHPRREQPERFDYAGLVPLSQWNPTPGMYTRYGDVRELVTAVDDRLLVMGSGDEVRLLFPAAKLPAVPGGWKRDFLLLVDGWAKDADANTAFSQSVEPLPFHRMSAYPYRSTEHFPDDASHREYLRKFQTRPALRLIRPLTD